MTRPRALTGIGVLVLAALVTYVATHTYWGDVTIPMPPKGEARTNPFYAAQRFAEALGARTAWDRSFSTPPQDSVIVLSYWHWDLSDRRRRALEAWVDAGGRLVAGDLLFDGGDAFERWSGVTHTLLPAGEDEEEPVDPDLWESCRTLRETVGAGQTPGGARRRVCGLVPRSFLASRAGPSWSLRDATGIQAVRVPVGRGSVTVINAEPFRGRDLFEGDHAWLFVAATGLRPGDEVRFLSEDDHPSLLALAWQHGAAVIVLGLPLVALALWRGAVRFGPIETPPEPARRSLAEQIRGTGRFALRHGGGESLHAAAVRALDEAARRHVPAYARLRPDERLDALARLTPFDRSALAAAIHHAGRRRAHELRDTIALIETARRGIGATTPPGAPHGPRRS